MAFYTPTQYCMTFCMNEHSFIVRHLNTWFSFLSACLAKVSSLSSQVYTRHLKGDPVGISRVSLDKQSSGFLGYYPTMILTFVTKFDKWQCTAIGLNSNFIQSTSIK